jgi:hypothetical protein
MPNNTPGTPPPVLYCPILDNDNLLSIEIGGLSERELYTTYEAAKATGEQILVLYIQTERMLADGKIFWYKTPNGTWLTRYIEPKYFHLGKP